MKVNLYLPDDLGRQAKEAQLPLSRLLQEAVRDELERRAAISKTLIQAKTFEFSVEDSAGRSYTGRITGTLLAVGHDESQLYLTEDERIIAYEWNRSRYWELGNEPSLSLDEEIRDFFVNDDDAYIDAMQALGKKPVVDL